ncbi:uncharacterized protein LOC109721544 [Ananas comosus]|uniref:Uncharacterized protein LOC109721544 n=1 Tax=Ananas comosus TaxID=4615 RepID=A0A6P5G860_ANACO|nr:uncharacterized protein LOC109721544 [Ananas comosus]
MRFQNLILSGLLKSDAEYRYLLSSIGIELGYRLWTLLVVKLWVELMWISRLRGGPLVCVSHPVETIGGQASARFSQRLLTDVGRVIESLWLWLLLLLIPTVERESRAKFFLPLVAVLEE